MENLPSVVLDVGTGKVSRHGVVIGKLNYNERLILCYLIDHAGEIVSRDVLLNAGWPDRIVVPNSLNIAMRNIRALMEISGHPGEPETVPKHGFRLSKGIASHAEVEWEKPHDDNISIKNDDTRGLSNNPDYEMFNAYKRVMGTIKKQNLHSYLYYLYVFSCVSLAIAVFVFIEVKKPTLYCDEFKGAVFCSAIKSDINEYKKSSGALQLKINPGERYFIIEEGDEYVAIKIN